MGLQGHFTSPTPSAPAPQAAPQAAPESPNQSTQNVSRETQNEPAPKSSGKTTKSVAKQAEAIVEQPAVASAQPDQLFEVVINGKQTQVTKEQLIRMAQKGEAADEKFNKASEMSRQASQILEYFKTNPTRALQELGHNVREMAESYLADEIRKEMMSPEQKEAMEWKRKAEEYEKMLKAGEEKAKAERISLEKAKYVKKYDEELTAAIDKAGLIKEPAIVKNIARIMHEYLERGMEITADEAVQEYNDTTLAQASQLIKLVGAARATQMLGDDFMNAIRKEDLKKLKNPLTPSGDNGHFGARDVPKREKQEKMTIEEWKRRNRERINA